MSERERRYPVSVVAQRLGWSGDTVRRMIRTGRLRGARIGNGKRAAWVVFASSMEELEKACSI